MDLIKYPDGSSYARINSESKSTFTFKINSYEDIWHLNQIVDAFNDLGVIPTITIPCLYDAQADRRFNKGESSGLKLVCRFLNSMKANFKIFHPHNPEVVEALMGNAEIIDNKKFISKVLYSICKTDANTYPVLRIDVNVGPESYYRDSRLDDNLVLMSSDAGGFKPLMKLCDKIEWKGQTASANKSRLWDGKESKLVQQIQCQDFEGKDILIIDDICVYGGTFKGLSKLLRERNCGKLYLAVSHLTLQNLGDTPVTNYFNKVFTTNSKYNYYTTDNNLKGVNGHHPKQPANLEIIKMF